MERKTTLRKLSFRECDKWRWRGGITEPVYLGDRVLEFLTELASIDIGVEREVIWVL